MKKYGFTLIELLAVIVILAIVAIIAVPAVVNVIEDARQGSFKNSAHGIIKAAEYNHSIKTINDSNPGFIKYTYTNGVENYNPSGYKLEYKGDQPNDGTLVVNEKGQVTLAIHNGTYCVEKGYYESEVTINKKTKEECDISSESTFVCGNFLLDTRDNNTYKTVKIGDQCWFAEDLRYDCSREGYNHIGSGNSWSGNNNCGNQGLGYNGLAYQWPVVMKESTQEGTQGLCPSAWHIPTDNEWKTLEMYLGMTQEDADKSDVYRGTNEGEQLKGLTPSWCKGTSGCGKTGFNALPAGNRSTGGPINDADSHGGWWTSSPSGSNVWYRYLNSGNSNVNRNALSQTRGRSVRCLLG